MHFIYYMKQSTFCLSAFEKQQIQDFKVQIWLDWQLLVLLRWEVQWHWSDDRQGGLPAAAWCRYKFLIVAFHFCVLILSWNMKSCMFCFAGIDKLLAQHVAHLFIRDPLSVFEEKIHLDDENESDHFEVRISAFPIGKLKTMKIKI